MQTKAGAIKIAAKKIGISNEEYAAKMSAGLGWCYQGAHWVLAKDRKRGLCAACREEQIKVLRTIPRKPKAGFTASL